MKSNRLFRVIRRDTIVLFFITLLSLVLNMFHLNREGYGNLYYAAGVKSMLDSWHNFFYLSYDPSGFITIDKPPLGFWLQAASAALFGFHGWALLLPQVVSGVLAVIVLYRLVSRVFGSTTGLIAALILAVTPISVATARNNTIDSILVLTVLLATCMLYKALEENGSPNWTLAAAAMIGVGFNIKMMAAYLVLPAFGALLLLNPRLNRLQKWKQLFFAALTMAVVSLSWATMVDLTPADQRPYVGSTQYNSVMELTLQHNAVDRFGIQNPFRLFTTYLGGQISWLLPLALLSAVILMWKAPLLRPMRLDTQQRAVLFWLTWLVPMTASFATAALFHRYYTVMMAPAIAALSAAGLVRLWRATIKREKSSYLLFAALFTTGGFAIFIAWTYEEVRIPLVVIIISLTIVSFLAFLAIFQLKKIRFRAHLYRIASVSGLLAVLAGPCVWAWTPALYGNSGSDPVAGPELARRHAVNLPSQEQERLNAYLQVHFRKGNFLVATPSAETASPLILDTGLPVMTMGGYSGTDPVLTKDRLEALAQQGRVQYFLIPSESEKKLPYISWIHQHCRVISSLSLPEQKPEFFLTKKPIINSFPSIILYQYMG
jgi:4-amino-4-deoxy-L-arabinose transferase-like glycosyltransferase